MRIPEETVAAASNAWVWVPENAVTIETPEYLLVRYPSWYEVDLEVLRLDPRRPLEVVVDEVLDRARDFDCPAATCWVKLDADPALDDALRTRGGVVDETVDVLALDLGHGVPDLGVRDPRIELRWMTDEETVRGHHEVHVDAFGGQLPPEAEIAAEAERGRADLARGSGSVVAYLDGDAVGTGGLSLVDGVARLWGGSVRRAARHRGIYRAVLEARLRRGLERGARMALVKGRVETSGPILRRAGFERYGEERSYRVPLD